MVLSNTLELENEEAYLDYFYTNFIKQKIHTFDGIRIYFRKGHFYHAFFETTISHKDCFSLERARHMPEILTILQSPCAICHCGWNSKEKRHDYNRRVSFLLGTFLVVVILSRNKQTGVLTGEFITCFEADAITFSRIQQDPLWNASMI
jgi:hypothetical protein